MRMQILNALQAALQSIGIFVEANKLPLEFAGDLAHGDFASSVALQYAKEDGIAPRALAEKIVESLGSIEGVKKIDIAGPGFINFYLTHSVFPSQLDIAKQKPHSWAS